MMNLLIGPATWSTYIVADTGEIVDRVAVIVALGPATGGAELCHVRDPPLGSRRSIEPMDRLEACHVGHPFDGDHLLEPGGGEC